MASSDTTGRRASARVAAADVPPVAPAASTSDALDYDALWTLARGGGASSAKELAAKLKEALAHPKIGVQATGTARGDRFVLTKWLKDNEPRVESCALTHSYYGFVRNKAPDWTPDEDAKLRAAVDLHGLHAKEKLAEAVGTRNAAQCTDRTRWLGLREPAAIMVYEYDAEDPTKHAISVMGDAKPVSARVARAAFAAMDVELLERHVKGVWSSLGTSFRGLATSKGKLVDILVAARVIPEYYEKGGSTTLRWTRRVQDAQVCARSKAVGAKLSRQAAADALRFDGGAPQPRVNSEQAHYGRLRKLKGLLLALKAGASKNELPTSAELPELFRGLRFPSFEDKPAGTYDEAQQCYICRVLYLLKGGRVIVEYDRGVSGRAARRAIL